MLDGDTTARRDALDQAISDALRIWTDSGAPDDGLIATDLARIQRQLHREDTTIGVFGLFKRGKSTLVNALVGADVSASGVVPETAVPVLVQHGHSEQATVHFANGVTPYDTDIAGARAWTSQAGNARNRHGVTHVVVTVPSPLLEANVRVLDTPGLDDADSTYTQRTMQHLDTVDAGLVVVSSPPTVGATEIAFLREVVAHTPDRVVVAVNILDHQWPNDHEVAQVVAYVRDQVAQVVADPVVVPVCALHARMARQTNDAALWERSGGAALLAAVSKAAGRSMRTERIERAWQQFAVLLDRAADELGVRLTSDHVPAVEAFDYEAARRAVAGHRSQSHAALKQVFVRSADAVAEASDPEAVDHALRRAARQLEVAAEDAFRHLLDGVAKVAQTAGLPEGSVPLRASVAAALAATDQERKKARPGKDGRALLTSPFGGAAVAGVAGGLGLSVASLALGPFGLVGGALLGYRLADLFDRSRHVDQLRVDAVERLADTRNLLLEELDRRTLRVLDAVGEIAVRRAEEAAADRAKWDADQFIVMSAQRRIRSLRDPAGTPA